MTSLAMAADWVGFKPPAVFVVKASKIIYPFAIAKPAVRSRLAF